ncbi:MAG: hypothetical protein WD898_00905 [Candidatus Paceibacterota bacterium]
MSEKIKKILTSLKIRYKHTCGHCGRTWTSEAQEAFCPQCNKGDKVSWTFTK